MINFAYNLLQSEYGTKLSNNFALGKRFVSQNYFDGYFLPHIHLLKNKK